MTSGDDHEGMDRRKFLGATAGAAGLAALAGCAAEEDGGDGNTTSSEGSSQTALTPPSAPPVPDDEYWAFVVESLEYQNEVLRRLDDGS